MEATPGSCVPANLNVRQVINTNLANTALATLPCAAWLFHIDSDEVVLLDRAAALETSSPDLRLEVLEGVSQWSWPDDEITHFKRLLGPDELVLLTAPGVIALPKNRGYRKWTVHGSSRTAGTRYQASRDLVRIARNTLVALEGRPMERVEYYVARVYERLVQEDFATLLELGHGDAASASPAGSPCRRGPQPP